MTDGHSRLVAEDSEESDVLKLKIISELIAHVEALEKVQCDF